MIEPFAGSAAVFMNTEYKRVLLADTNADLIHLYRLLKEESAEFINYASKLFTPEYNEAEQYYAFRAEFNASKNPRRKSALFIYLNRHGYNGLCRYNAKGGYNVPFGRYKKPYFPAIEMQEFSRKSKNAEFKIADFREVMRAAKVGDVVYCDPPYVPLSKTSNFTSYGAKLFGEAEQKELAELAKELSARGVPVIISNHDTDFTRAIYADAKLTHFDVQRFISSNGKNRGRARELLAVFKAN